MVIEYNDQIYDSHFNLVSKFKDEDDDKVTSLDIQNNLKNYTLKELKSLATILINSVCDLTK